MRFITPLIATILLPLMLVGCTSASREGLPSGSPFLAAGVVTPEALPQGVAVGDVTGHSALVWARTDGPATVDIEWAPASAWDAAEKMGTAVWPILRTHQTTMTAESDFTATIPLSDLVPRTRYRYHVLVRPVAGPGEFIEAVLAARGEFATLPDEGTSVPVTFAWSGDLGGQQRCRVGADGYPIFDLMRRQALDFFLFLGDTIYSDNACPAPPNEPGADFKATTLDQYRARHRYQRGAASLRRFLASVPVYVTWDDHEVKNNFAGPHEEHMPAGRQALREYWPIASPQDDPQRLYRAVRYGADMELFILDDRQYRSNNSEPDGLEKTMLGKEQLRWLLLGLQNSLATWKVIATSVPLSIPKGGGVTVPGNDGWAGGPDGTGFEYERQVIVDTILTQHLKNVVFLAGDVHYVQASVYDSNGDGVPDFHEFVAGPLSAAPGRMSPPTLALNATNLIQEGGYDNFGLVRVSDSAFDVTVLDDKGTVRFSYHLAAK